MLSSPKAKSVEVELLKAVFSTNLSKDVHLLERARSVLLSQFLKSADANLAYLGLDMLSLLLDNLKQQSQ